MEITPQLPVWLTLLVTGGVAVAGVAALVRTVEAVLDLDAG